MFICLAVIGPALTLVATGASALTPFELMTSWTAGMGLSVVFVLVSRRSTVESWAAMRLARSDLALPLALIIGVAIGLAIDLFINLADGRFLPPPQAWGLQSRGALSALMAALLLIVLQPAVDTFVFQAVLLPRLRWRLGPWAGLLATAALYALLHHLVFYQAYDFYSVGWHGFAWPLLLGISFCVLKVYSRSSLATLVARIGAASSSSSPPWLWSAADIQSDKGSNQMNAHQLKIGDIDCAILHEGESDLIAGNLALRYPGVTQAQIDQVLGDQPPSGSLNLPYIKSGGARIIADVGFGEAGRPSAGGTEAALELLGLRPADIDIVYLTHFHGDHIAGMTDSSGDLAFPKARYITTQAEWDEWIGRWSASERAARSANIWTFSHRCMTALASSAPAMK